jgi:hypothetical protein
MVPQHVTCNNKLDGAKALVNPIHIPSEPRDPVNDWVLGVCPLSAAVPNEVSEWEILDSLLGCLITSTLNVHGADEHVKDSTLLCSNGSEGWMRNGSAKAKERTPEELQEELWIIRMLARRLEEDQSNCDKTILHLEKLRQQMNSDFMAHVHHASLKLKVLWKKPLKLDAVLLSWVIAMETALNLFKDPDLKTGWFQALVIAARAQGFKS